MARRLVLAVLLSLLAAPTARAATVSIVSQPDTSPRVDEVRYVAADGERNRLAVTRTIAEAWVFEESGAELVAGEGCRGGGGRVTCRPASREVVVVGLGDGDDELVLAADPTSIGTVRADGGPGANRMHDRTGAFSPRGPSLSGGDGDDAMSTDGFSVLAGDAGHDRLVGSANGETLSGGAGADELLAGDGGDLLDPGRDSDADVLDGGPGADIANYGGDQMSLLAVEVDLALGRGDPGDVLRSIEGASGTPASDRLAGSAAPNDLRGLGGDDTIRGADGDDRLEGNDGRDRIEGGAGDDELIGGAQSDTLSGGPGDDRINPGYIDEVFGGQAARNRVACGPGRDLMVVYGSHLTAVPRDCERVDVLAGFLDKMNARPRLTRSTATWSVLCSKAAPRSCEGRFELAASGRHLGRADLRLAVGERRDLRVRLNAAGRAFAARGGLLRVRVLNTVGISVPYLVRVPAAR